MMTRERTSGAALQTPFYDPEKSYAENFDAGPFGLFAEPERMEPKGSPQFSFLGHKVFAPFGIPAGPLLNGRYVKAALDLGFDIPVYKTVRTRKYACHEWPNVLGVDVDGDLMPGQRLVGQHKYSEPLSITNSFGVPSFAPDFWQRDLADAVQYARRGQLVMGSFQGTGTPGGTVAEYVADFVLAARLLKETGVKAIEVNLSCPNEGTAHLLCHDTERSERVIEAIKTEIGSLPLVAKCSYFAEDTALRRLAVAIGKNVDGISVINTISAEIVDGAGAQALPGDGRLRSGVCGRAIRWAGLEMTERLAAVRADLGMKFAIVGVGGVANVEDYKAYRAAGADAVMSATAAMWNPLLAQEIKHGI